MKAEERKIYCRVISHCLPNVLAQHVFTWTAIHENTRQHVHTWLSGLDVTQCCMATM
jgi:hypothetical protein